MTAGRRIHFGEQVVEERRQIVAVMCLPSAVVNPGVGQGILWRGHGKCPIGASALSRVALAPALDVDNLAGLGPIGHNLGDQLIPVQRTSPATYSADPRQRVADQQINDSGAAKPGLKQDQSGRIRSDAADHGRPSTSPVRAAS